MTGRERMITTTRAGAIFMLGNGSPRCMTVVDSHGRNVTGPGQVDLPTAVRTLNNLFKVDAGTRGHGRAI